MEVVVPISPSQDFFFPSNSLYMSAPASPKPFGNPSEYCYFLSAPASPRGSSFNWEEKPEPDSFDFAFGFSRELDGDAPAPADELFEGGKIRPLNCSLQQQSPAKRDADRRDQMQQGRGKGRDAADVTQKIDLIGNSSSGTVSAGERGRAPASPEGYSRSRRGTRSLSPLRGGGRGEFENSRNPSPSSAGTSLIRGCGSKKWSLKDFFLFRSASDGRAIGRGSKDPLRKYTLLSPSASASSSSSSSSSSLLSPSTTRKNGEIGGTAATATKRGKGSAPASAHAMHYTANRAALEEMKKKTPLPFHRNSLFGYLRFNPAINSIGRRLNSYSFHRRQS